jgi:hypothetical protein
MQYADVFYTTIRMMTVTYYIAWLYYVLNLMLLPENGGRMSKHVEQEAVSVSELYRF